MFTPQEKAEVLKIVQAAQLIATAVGKIADALQTVTAPMAQAEHNRYATAITRIEGGDRALNLLLQHFLWAYENNQVTRTDRATQVATGFGMIPGTVASLQFGINNGISGVPAMEPARAPVEQAIALLQSINQTLTYAEPFPEDYPRIVGPHGNYDLAQSMIATSSKYLSEGTTGISWFFIQAGNHAVWPSSANGSLATFIRATADAQASLTRVMGLSADIVLPADDASITIDHAAGSGLRPRSFFRQILSHELAMTARRIKNFAGRTTSNGVSFSFRRILGAAGDIYAKFSTVTPTTQFLNQLNGPANFMTDLANSWSALDDWSNANLFFFFEIPEIPGMGGGGGQPPAVIPAGFFASEVAQLDEIKARADAVRANLTAKEGQPV